MKKAVLLLAACIPGLLGMAQSAHSSQFYSTPLLINPAATGLTAGPYRFAGNYRSQWNDGGSPYKTFSFSGDAQILKDRLADGNILGLGLTFVNDQTMEGVVQTNNLAISAGYHISLDPENIHAVGAGFQASYNERRIDFSGLQFENQYDGIGFDPSLPVGEELMAGKKYFFDMNLGAMYSYLLDDRSFFAGVAGYNLLKQEETYLTEQFKTPPLYSVIAGGDLDIGFNNSLYFSGNYRRQGNNHETTLGMAYGFFLDQEGYSALRLGLWYRMQDALIPYAGLTYNGVQVGVSYDYTVSDIKTRAQVRNAFEISVIYIRPDQSELKRLIPWY